MQNSVSELSDGCISPLLLTWKMAEPQTTKINNARSQGPTGYFSSRFFYSGNRTAAVNKVTIKALKRQVLTLVLETFPRSVTFFDAFSLAIFIFWCLTIFAAVLIAQNPSQYLFTTKQLISQFSHRRMTTWTPPTD